MDLNHTIFDPDGAISLPATLEDGIPIPMHMITEIQTLEGDEDVVIATPGVNVRLRTSGSDMSNDELETSVILPLAERPIATPYPGLNLNPHIDPQDYSDLSDNDVMNVTLAPMVDRANNTHSNVTMHLELPTIAEEVLNDPLDNSDVGDLTNTDSDNTLDLGFMMVLSNDSIGAPVLCFAPSESSTSINNPTFDDNDSNEWETQSEEEVPQRPADPELTIDCPVRKEDVSKLTAVPVSILAKSKNMAWFSKVLTYRHPNKAYEQVMLQYYVMSLLSLILAPDSEELALCHAQISYSSAEELRRRLAHFSSDLFTWETIMIPHGHMAKNCTVLWGLVGNLAQIMKHNSCDNDTLMNVKTQMLPLWDEQQQNWLEIMEKLPLRKMPHSRDSEHYEYLQQYKKKVASNLDSVAGQKREVWNGLKKCWMPLPNIVLTFPHFRELPLVWGVINNVLCVVPDPTSSEMTSQLTPKNLARFRPYQLTATALRMTNIMLELIASTITRIIANRWTMPYSQTEYKYDAEYNVIETDEPGPHITPTYYGDTCSIPAEIFERAIRLMSSTAHQSLILWHQMIQGHLTFACPYASLMPQSMSSRKWNINEIISSFQCFNCYHDQINNWAPCVRLSSQINTHPNLVSRSRQLWFIIINFLKFLRCGPEYGDDDFEFQGEHEVEHHAYHPNAAEKRKLILTTPKYLQKSTIISYGNEALVSRDGYFAGSNILLNSGNASHGGGENRGLSKAVCMLGALLTCPSQYAISMNWTMAWTPIDMTRFRPHFRPILIALATSLDFYYWNLEYGIDSEGSEIRSLFQFMPICDTLLLGTVLQNYAHDMTRMIRDLAFITTPDIPVNISIGPTLLDNDLLGLHYSTLRADFKAHFKFNMCPCNVRCPWNIKITQFLLHVWEFIQVTMMNLKFHPDRPILTITEFRVSETAILILVNKFMCYVRHPFIGYRVRPQYEHLLPKCEGRPRDYCLSAIYLFDGIEGYSEARQQLYRFTNDERKYPGAH